MEIHDSIHVEKGIKCECIIIWDSINSNKQRSCNLISTNESKNCILRHRRHSQGDRSEFIQILKSRISHY